MTNREQALEWFFAKNEIEKTELKEKYFPNTPIPYSSQWGFHFNFGQIEEMYLKEIAQKIKKQKK